MSNFVLPQISKLVLKDGKVAAVGLIRLLIQSTLSLKEPNLKNMVRPKPVLRHVYRSHRLCAAGRSPLPGQLAGLFRGTNVSVTDTSNDGTGATETNLEEQAAGYQLRTRSLLQRARLRGT